MLRKLSLAAGLLVAVAMSPSMAASPTSAPQSLLPRLSEFEDGAVHRVQERYQYGRFWGYYSRCHYRRRACARRWGWGTWRYRRCLYWHACRVR